jgi:two-component system chemotaxis response regulator CheB
VLYRLTREAPGQTPPIPHDIPAEVEIALHPAKAVSRDEELGTLAPLTCPECGGPLWELHNDQLPRYRCRLGHAFTDKSLLDGQAEIIETALWTAVRTMEERARILTLLTHKRRDKGQLKLVTSLEKQVAELKMHAQHLRQILLDHK